MEINLSDKVQVKGLIDDGIPCYYRCGFRYKGAEARPISPQKALELLPSYSPGMGFYELCSEKINGKDSLVFNEFSESDLF